MQYLNVIEETREFPAGEAGAGVRLDRFLVQAAPEFSRSFLQKLVDGGLVFVNGKTGKSGCKLRPGDLVTLNIPRPVSMDAAPEDIPLDILYEDPHLIVINKRPGMVVHAAPGHANGTLVNALLYHCGDLSGIGGELRPGIVHRLDMDTSGCIVCAKTDAAHRALAEQFAAHTVRKRYLAITRGVPREPEGKVEGYIMRQAQDWQRLRFQPLTGARLGGGVDTLNGGKYSLTFYKTRGAARDCAFIECEIKTGRTHQIRLHLKSLGAPILCDALYGKETAVTAAELTGGKNTDAAEPVLKRQALHAAYLSFIHPADGTEREFTAPLPDDMRETLAILGIVS